MRHPLGHPALPVAAAAVTLAITTLTAGASVFGVVGTAVTAYATGVLHERYSSATSALAHRPDDLAHRPDDDRP